MKKIKIGIVGYGNVGKAAELLIGQNSDMELKGIFTRRPASIITKNPVAIYNTNLIGKQDFDIDVMLMCGGSKEDLYGKDNEHIEDGQVIQVAKHFNTVDTFDTHKRIPECFEQLDEICRMFNTLCLMSTAWDPGILSLMRVLFESCLPNGKQYTFWGEGVSQGHSDAARRVVGVKDARSYTIPIESSIEAVRKGDEPSFIPRTMHERVVYVVPEEDANEIAIMQDIVTMPDYFADYDTEVIFISEEEMKKCHSEMPHGGFVLRHGKTGDGNSHLMEFSLKLDNNPEFAASIMLANARAVHELNNGGKCGAITILDIPIGYFSPKSAKELRGTML